MMLVLVLCRKKEMDKGKCSSLQSYMNHLSPMTTVREAKLVGVGYLWRILQNKNQWDRDLCKDFLTQILSGDRLSTLRGGHIGDKCEVIPKGRLFVGSFRPMRIVQVLKGVKTE